MQGTSKSDQETSESEMCQQLEMPLNPVAAREYSDLDEEIAQLEQLISLQTRKVDLLRQKRERAQGSNETNPTFDVPQPESANKDTLTTTQTKYATFSSPQKESMKSKASRLRPRANANVAKFDRLESDLEKRPQCGMQPPDYKPPQRAESTRRFSDQFSRAFNRSQLHPHLIEDMPGIDAMQRFSRISTDLANERNLLAWCRTSLACVRTCFAVMALESVDAYSFTTWRGMVICLGVLSFWMYAHGLQRYSSMKKILFMERPPLFFGRFSNYPQAILMLVALFVIALMASARKWVH